MCIKENQRIVFITILIAFMLGFIPIGYLLSKNFSEIDRRAQGKAIYITIGALYY